MVCVFVLVCIVYRYFHYDDVIIGAMASQITSLTIVYSTVYSDADQRKHQSSTSLAFVRGIHRGPVNCPHKWPVTRKMFPFHDVIVYNRCLLEPIFHSELCTVCHTIPIDWDNNTDALSNRLPCWMQMIHTCPYFNGGLAKSSLKLGMDE